MDSKKSMGGFGDRAREFEEEEIKELEEEKLPTAGSAPEKPSEKTEAGEAAKMDDLNDAYNDYNNIRREIDKLPAESPESESSAGSDKERAKDSLDDTRNRLSDMLNAADKDIQKSGESIDKIREKLGIKEVGGGVVRVSQNLRQELSADRRRIESDIYKMEKEVLEVPPNAGAEQRGGEDLKLDFNAYLREVGEIKKEYQKAREDFVKEFIEKSTEKVLKDFNEYISGSKNKDIAKDLIELKTEKEIEYAAQDFIEKGGQPNFGFSSRIEYCWFDNEDGERVQYITGYTIHIGGFDEKVGGKTTYGGESMVLPSAQKAMFDKRIQGGMNKEGGLNREDIDQ